MYYKQPKSKTGYAERDASKRNSNAGNMSTNRGVTHIITIILLFFAIIGVWYVYKSYQEHQLERNLTVVYSDYKAWAFSITKDMRDKKELQEAFSKIEEITQKYKKAPLPKIPQQ